MNLTEVSSNLPDLDPEPAPEPPATNKELTKISTFEDETGTGTEHPANSTEKTSWARCMLTDDVQVSICERERERKRQKQQVLTITHPPAGRFTFEPDGGHTQLP